MLTANCIAVAASTAREWAQITIPQTMYIATCRWRTSWISVTKWVKTYDFYVVVLFAFKSETHSRRHRQWISAFTFFKSLQVVNHFPSENTQCDANSSANAKIRSSIFRAEPVAVVPRLTRFGKSSVRQNYRQLASVQPRMQSILPNPGKFWDRC